jgi:hypothetical protein
MHQIVDKTARLSRATLRRDLAKILRKFGANVDKPGGCHELPSALEAREIGSRSALGVDSVTSQSGGA